MAGITWTLQRLIEPILRSVPFVITLISISNVTEYLLTAFLIIAEYRLLAISVSFLFRMLRFEFREKTNTV